MMRWQHERKEDVAAAAQYKKNSETCEELKYIRCFPKVLIRISCLT